MTPRCAPRCSNTGANCIGVPPYMRARYESWIEGLNGDWLISRQRYFGVPFPVWYALDANGDSIYDTPIVPPESSLPIDPSSRRAAPGYDESHARQAEWFHRRLRRHGYVGNVVTHARDRLRLGGRPRSLLAHVPDGPAPASPRDHPHVAVLHRRASRARVRSTAVEARGDLRLDPRSRPQEDVEVERQRRHTDGAHREVGRRLLPLLGRVWSARHRYRVRRGPAEDRQEARDEDPQRHEVRPRHRERANRRSRRSSPRRSTNRCSCCSRRCATRRRWRSKDSTTHARSSAPNGSSGSSATTTSNS